MGWHDVDVLNDNGARSRSAEDGVSYHDAFCPTNPHDTCGDDAREARYRRVLENLRWPRGVHDKVNVERDDRVEVGWSGK